VVGLGTRLETLVVHKIVDHVNMPLDAESLLGGLPEINGNGRHGVAALDAELGHLEELRLIFPWVSSFAKHLLLFFATNSMKLLVGKACLCRHRDGVLDRVILTPQIVEEHLVLVSNVPHSAVKHDGLILLFWDPTCGHCEIEIPKLKEIYEKEKDSLGIKIFTVCSDSSLVKWKEAIRKKQMNWINVNGPRTLTGDFHEQYDIISTPVIYLLDEKKTIIAKHIGTEQIVIFLKNFLRMRSKK